ncbi:MAG TPA: DUF1345 domain-containing protein [Novosphingobium sp.]|nr:DUF1345 domain-containing protein [Novosphingobium sp.]HZV09322.1 DUF1345 domain-containing protein [Novosphingobium sp.]
MAAGRAWLLPPRFAGFMALMAIGVALALPLVERPSQALLAGFDAGVLGFLASLVPLVRKRSAADMRAHASANDSGRLGMLAITGVLMLVIATGVAVELPDARRESGPAHVAALVLVLASLVLAWLFSNVVYALHYAHMYYRGAAEGGLGFPHHNDQPHAPDYWDFLYFSLTIGMAFATSDVTIGRGDIRRIVTLHGAAAFFYNLIVLAFTVNVTAGG